VARGDHPIAEQSRRCKPRHQEIYKGAKARRREGAKARQAREIPVEAKPCVPARRRPAKVYFLDCGKGIAQRLWKNGETDPESA